MIYLVWAAVYSGDIRYAIAQAIWGKKVAQNLKWKKINNAYVCFHIPKIWQIFKQRPFISEEFTKIDRCNCKNAYDDMVAT